MSKLSLAASSASLLLCFQYLYSPILQDGTTTTTNVEAWGPPGANLSVPSCKSDFGNHVIVFNIDFCGD